jgi:hypothetical protein
MAYDITELTELIRYHLVLGEDTNAAADRNLANLVRNIERLATKPLFRTVEWIACEGCGAWVDSDLVGPDGAGVDGDGGFYCASCRWDGDDCFSSGGIG